MYNAKNEEQRRTKDKKDGSMTEKEWMRSTDQEIGTDEKQWR